eukprot:2864944-Pyramimonas_sp.AAC.1
MQEMQNLVSTMSAQWEERFQQATGSSIVVDERGAWHDCSANTSTPSALVAIEARMEAKFRTFRSSSRRSH